MPRLTALVTTAATAAIAVAGLASPAFAEAVVYENQTVQSNPPKKPGHEYASFDVPTGYDKHRLNWHTVGFFEQVDQGRAIIMDLHPKSDTVKELRAERDAFADEAGDSYEEFAFKVNDKDDKVRAQWVFTYSAEGTGDVDPYISVMLMSGNRLQVTGKLSEKKFVRDIRQHVVKSVVLPS